MNCNKEESEQRPSEKDEKQTKRNERRKRMLLEEAKKLKRRGIVYLSRVPPNMERIMVCQLLSKFGEIERVYLAPEDPEAKLRREKPGGYRKQGFSEGWVEFADKHVAKRVANLLNGEQIGGKKRSQFYFDLWNIKYLSNFKWDDLTEEIAYKKAVREQKLVMEMSAAKKERDFYMSKVEKSKALDAIDERMKKKQKLTDNPGDQQEATPKMIRFARQTKPVADIAGQSKPGLSRDVLAAVTRTLQLLFTISGVQQLIVKLKEWSQDGSLTIQKRVF